MLRAMGFSTTTCFPLLAAMIVWGAWKRFGLEIHTASTFGSAQSFSMLSYSLAFGKCSPNRLRTTGSMSAPATSSSSSISAMAGMISVAPTPMPMIPIFNVRFWPVTTQHLVFNKSATQESDAHATATHRAAPSVRHNRIRYRVHQDVLVTQTGSESAIPVVERHGAARAVVIVRMVGRHEIAALHATIRMCGH